MNWSVAEAKAKLSEVLDRARQEPQIIENRGRPVAVVVSVEGFVRLKALEVQARPSPMEDFLRRCEALRAKGDLDLETAPRLVEADRAPPTGRRDLLRQWLEDLLTSTGVEIVPVDAAVAREAGKLKAQCEAAGRPRPLIDLLIAATAHVTGDVVVTPNTADFEGLGVALLNPFR